MMDFTQPDRNADAAEWRAIADIQCENRGHEIMANGMTTAASPLLAGDKILAIAQADALRAYGDLSPYKIQLALEADGWHVDYELNNPMAAGGGPHYVIDAQTGAIVSKRYEQ